MLSVDYVKHLYNPSYTLVQPGLYVYCMVMYYISSQLSQAIYNNTIIWSDMNIIKNIALPGLKYLAQLHAQKMKFYPGGGGGGLRSFWRSD